MAEALETPAMLEQMETRVMQAMAEVQETPVMPHQATGQERQETQAAPVTRAGRRTTRTKV